MVKSPSLEVNISLVSQEIYSVLRTPEVHYCIYKRLQLVPLLSQIHPAHSLSP